VINFTIDIEPVLKGFDRFEDAIIRALLDGCTNGSRIIRAHMTAGHGPSAHGMGRFQQQSGRLVDEMKVIPSEIKEGVVTGGVLVAMPYAAPVEFGHDIRSRGRLSKKGKITLGGIKGTAKAYPYARPAAEDTEVQRKVFEAFKSHVTLAIRNR
jgi:hypothetical protein